jgi:hypothetical protein
MIRLLLLPSVRKMWLLLLPKVQRLKLWHTYLITSSNCIVHISEST